MNEEAAKLAVRMRRLAGLPDDYTGSVALHFHQGRPTRAEPRYAVPFPKLTATDCVDETPNKDVA